MVTPRKGCSLLLVLTMLVALTITATALPITALYHYAVTHILLSAQQSLAHSVARNVATRVGHPYQQAQNIVRQVAQSGLGAANDTARRQAHVPLLIALLHSHPLLESLGVAYADGSLLRVYHYQHQLWPEGAAGSAWVVRQLRQQGNGVAVSDYRFLDHALQPSGDGARRYHRYDPRQRDWYRRAVSSGERITDGPYAFTGTGTLGISFAQEVQEGGAVASAELRLESLILALQHSQPDESTLLAIVDDRQRLITSNQPHGANLLPLRQARQPVLAAFGRHWPDDSDAPLQLAVGGQRWFAHIEILGVGRWRLLSAQPESVLLAQEQQLIRQVMIVLLLLALLLLPLGWLVARAILRPIQQLVLASQRIRHMDFSGEPPPPSALRELNELVAASEGMKETIRDFIGLSRQIVSEQQLEPLIERVLRSSTRVLPTCAYGMWLTQDQWLRPYLGYDAGGQLLALQEMPLADPLFVQLPPDCDHLCLDPQLVPLPPALRALLVEDSRQLVLIPLRSEQRELLALMALAIRPEGGQEQQHRLNFLHALASFAAIAIDNRRLAGSLRQLMFSLVELIAGAIDAKSPYTGRHCQRVPDIAQALAEAAHECEHGTLAGFHMSEQDREALYIASWLHDCGKVTTPEYVIDKATKLETIHDRIHEIRTRFEVLKRDADITYWQGVAEGGDAAGLAAARDAEQARLDDDFAFIARCNVGREDMDDADQQRLQQIAARRWTRTLDDRQGLGPLEQQRLAAFPPPPLPACEPLLSDKAEHCQARPPRQQLASDNPWRITMTAPALAYNKGELYNLSVRRGTLTAEERYIINEHIVETIKMLDALPFPPHLRTVPEIACGHHERIDGQGYPRGLNGEQMSVLARVMAIADVFEALTASDRPYKAAKPMDEVLAIMRRMSDSGHLDAELFQLFESSGVWRNYAATAPAGDRR